MGSLSNFMAEFGSADDNDSALLAMSQPEGLDSFIGEFAGISESYFFYDNTVEIKFDKVEHQYFLVDPDLGNLIPLLNVSTVCKIIDKSDALIPWAAKMTVEKLLRTIPTYNAELDPNQPPVLTLKHLTLEEFTKLALEAKSAHKDKLEDAGAVGKEAHDWIERYIKAVLANNIVEINLLLHDMCKDPRATNAANASLDWMRKHNVRWKETERKVYSKKHRCSGTLDGLCIVDSCDDRTCCPKEFKDRLSIADWKTSNYLYIEYLFQTAAYEAFYEEEFNVDVQDRWVLRLGKDDGEFEPWYLPAENFEEDFAGFLGCLSLMRLVDSVDERMKDHKKTVREAKKAARAIQKAAEKAAEKMRKAEEKAEAKRVREIEKQKIKAEAKAERERLKTQAKAEKENFEVSPVSDTALQSLPETIVAEVVTAAQGGAESELVANEQTTHVVSAPVLSVEYDDEPQFKPIAIPEE